MSRLELSAASRRLAQPGSDVWRVHYAALDRLERGDDIMLLSVGDPDFDTPREITHEVIHAINSGRTHYSPAQGEPSLRRAVAELESRSTGLNFTAEDVVIFPGATATLFGVFASILDAGSGVVVPEPMYVGYHNIFEAIGADVQTVPLEPPNFELDVDRLLARIEDHTRAVLVNTPGNPLGNIIPEAALRRLAAECRKRDVWLICDEVYSLITFEQPHCSLLKCAEDISNVGVIDGLSKSHAMSGWRVGWLIGAPALTAAATRFSGAALFGVSQFIQDAAVWAIENDAADVDRMRRAYQARRDYVVGRIRAIPKLDCFVPAAGMFVMIDTSKAANSGADFADLLLDSQGISTIPGAAFGPSATNYVRLSLTVDETGLGTAFDRIEAALR
ncbi:MAG: pyridoxal phosphate-dependent aminotransferase [Pseudomonadota bacterium]